MILRRGHDVRFAVQLLNTPNQAPNFCLRDKSSDMHIDFENKHDDILYQFFGDVKIARNMTHEILAEKIAILVQNIGRLEDLKVLRSKFGIFTVLFSYYYRSKQ